MSFWKWTNFSIVIKGKRILPLFNVLDFALLFFAVWHLYAYRCPFSWNDQMNKNNLKKWNAIKCPSDFVNLLCYEFNIKFSERIKLWQQRRLNATVQNGFFFFFAFVRGCNGISSIWTHWASANVCKWISATNKWRFFVFCFVLLVLVQLQSWIGWYLILFPQNECI